MYDEEELRAALEASETLINVVMGLEGCSRDEALQLLRKAEITAYREVLGPGPEDTLH